MASRPVPLRVSAPGEEARDVEGSPALSLLNALLRAGIRVRHDCGGKALCGTCRVRASGALGPVGEREAARLAAVGAGPGERLACQAFPYGEASIELPPEVENGR